MDDPLRKNYGISKMAVNYGKSTELQLKLRNEIPKLRKVRSFSVAATTVLMSSTEEGGEFWPTRVPARMKKELFGTSRQQA